MKKMMKRVLSLVTVLVMMTMLTACGEQDKFIGSWQAEVNMAKYIMEGVVEEDAELAEYFNFDDFTLVLQMTFYEDGTFKQGIDTDAMQEAVDGLKEDFKEGMKKYLEDMIASSGLDMTVDEVLASSGQSLDDIADESFTEEMFDELEIELTAEGNFEVKDGKLYMSDGLEYGVDENVYDTYEITKNELKLLESFGLEEDEDMDDLYPLIFTRVR